MQTPTNIIFLPHIHTQKLYQQYNLKFLLYFHLGDAGSGWKTQPFYYMAVSFLLNPCVV